MAEKRDVSVEKSSIVISEKSQGEEKKAEKGEVTPVIKGNVRRHKKGLVKRVVDAFVGEDVGDVKSYLIYDVTIPAVKNLFFDIVSNGTSMVLFGDAKPRGNVRRSGNSSYISYNSVTDRRDYRSTRERRDYARVNNRAAHEFDDILFETREDAEMVLSNLVDFTEIYGQATVADLYDLVGVTGQYTDRGFGWKALGSSRVMRAKDGYILDLPKAEVLM